MDPIFFASAAELRRWLEQHHATASALEIGFYKKGAGKTGVTYAEAVEEALCFGWIDGVVHRIDAQRYRQRYTPRRPGSTWSRINVARVGRLIAAGRMHPAGLAAFAARTAAKTGIYSFESPPKNLPRPFEQRFRANRAAWTFFESQPPGYRRTAIHFVLSAKQEPTRERRLARLIADSAAGRRLKETLSDARATRRAARTR